MIGVKYLTIVNEQFTSNEQYSIYHYRIKSSDHSLPKCFLSISLIEQYSVSWLGHKKISDFNN